MRNAICAESMGRACCEMATRILESGRCTVERSLAWKDDDVLAADGNLPVRMRKEAEKASARMLIGVEPIVQLDDQTGGVLRQGRVVEQVALTAFDVHLDEEQRPSPELRQLLGD